MNQLCLIYSAESDTKQINQKRKTVKMLMAINSKKFEMHDVTVSSLDGLFEIETTLTKVEEEGR